MFLYAPLLQDDTSGDYCEMLLALIGEREIPAPSAEELEEAQEEQEMEEVEEEKIEVRGLLKTLGIHIGGGPLKTVGFIRGDGASQNIGNH